MTDQRPRPYADNIANGLSTYGQYAVKRPCSPEPTPMEQRRAWILERREQRRAFSETLAYPLLELTCDRCGEQYFECEYKGERGYTAVVTTGYLGPMSDITTASKILCPACAIELEDWFYRREPICPTA